MLSIVGDPLGKVVNVAVKPVGALTGGVGEPAGDAALNMKKQMKKEEGYSNENLPVAERPGGKPVGGNEQTGENPLGL